MRAEPDAPSAMPDLTLLTVGARSIEPRPDPRDRPDTYPRGRRCGFFVVHEHGIDECPTILNMYNPGPYCLLHAQKIESKILHDETRRLQRAAA